MDLAEHLRRVIAADGAIGVDRFMTEVLGHETLGYYQTRDPLGAAGDFITAPEVSQMFGELIGLWCAAVWQTMGRPDPVLVLELGPGRGTLMGDALRAVAKTVPGFPTALRLHLVETGPALRRKQEAALAQYRPTWHDTLESVPPGPMLLIANEFFDALPVRQIVRQKDGWHERVVVADEPGGGFALRPAPGPSAPPGCLPERLRAAPAGSIFEFGPRRAALARDIGRRLARDGGAALVLDYGHARSAAGDTLQAVKGHRYHDPLRDPGEADLTAHVDFEALGAAARSGGAAVYGPVEQGRFLRALGIEARRATLLRGAGAEQARALDAGFNRLVDSDKMGTLFKAMAFADPALPAPPGFPEAARQHARESAP